jgi:hypothetical protein
MVEINKTWKDRIVHPFVNFFENFNTDTNGIGGSGSMLTIGYYYKNSYTKSHNNKTEYLHSCSSDNLKYFLCSKEIIDEIDNINEYLFNGTFIDRFIAVDSIATNIIGELDDYTIQDNGLESKGNKYGYAYTHRRSPHIGVNSFFSMFRAINDGGEIFQKAIRAAVPGKENVMMQTLPANFTDLEITHDYVAKTTHLKYDKPIKLKEHFNYQEYLDGGNTDLFLMIPYKNSMGDVTQNIYNPTTKLNRPQFSYIALKITDLDGDGDIKFDHIDKIDYLDGFEVTISTQRLI